MLKLNEFFQNFLLFHFFEIRDKIVIVRYGEIFRGDKCHMAEQRGAVGCLIYSDPQDDGTSQN
jgi:N-acetylated-alpha-linked acidic dipeptidase